MGAGTHGLREFATIAVADVARRRADESGDAMTLGELTHIDTHQRLFTAEDFPRECLRQIGLPYARRAKEEEGSDGMLSVTQPETGTLHGTADDCHGIILPDDTAAELRGELT